MKWFICFCSALMLGIAAASATPPPDGMQLAKVESSGIQDIVVEHYTANNPTGPSRKEVWLSERDNRDKRVFLFRHVRLAEVMIAPDQKHLVINNAFSSTSSSLLVYERINGLEYKMVNDGKAVSSSISKALAQKLGYSVQDKLDHLYMRAEKWDGPGQLVVKVSGHGGKSQLDGASVSVTIPEIEVAVLTVPTQQQAAQADGGLPPASAPSIQPGSSGKGKGSASTAPAVTLIPAKRTVPAPTPTPPPAPVTEVTPPTPAPEQPKRPEVVVVPPVPQSPTRQNDPSPVQLDSGNEVIPIPPPSPLTQQQQQDDIALTERRAANVPPPSTVVTEEQTITRHTDPYYNQQQRRPAVRFSTGSSTFEWIPGTGIRHRDRYESDRDIQPYPRTSSSSRTTTSRNIRVYTPESDSAEGRGITELLAAYFKTRQLDIHHLRVGANWAFVDVTPERRRQEGGSGPRTQMLLKEQSGEGWVILRSTIGNMRGEGDSSYGEYLVKVMSAYSEAPTALFPRGPLKAAVQRYAGGTRQDDVSVDVDVNVDVDIDGKKNTSRTYSSTDMPQRANSSPDLAATDPSLQQVDPKFGHVPEPAANTAAARTASGTYEPAKGSDERKLIMDTLRASLDEITGKKCVFKVTYLRVNGRYACIRFTPLDAETEQPVNDPGTAILHKDNGTWSVSIVEGDRNGRVGERLLSDVSQNFPGLPRELLPQ